MKMKMVSKGRYSKADVHMVLSFECGSKDVIADRLMCEDGFEYVEGIRRQAGAIVSARKLPGQPQQGNRGPQQQSQQPQVPAGWEIKATLDGREHYVDHNTGITTSTHPNKASTPTSQELMSSTPPLPPPPVDPATTSTAASSPRPRTIPAATAARFGVAAAEEGGGARPQSAPPSKPVAGLSTPAPYEQVRTFATGMVVNSHAKLSSGELDRDGDAATVAASTPAHFRATPASSSAASTPPHPHAAAAGARARIHSKSPTLDVPPSLGELVARHSPAQERRPSATFHEPVRKRSSSFLQKMGLGTKKSSSSSSSSSSNTPHNGGGCAAGSLEAYVEGKNAGGLVEAGLLMHRETTDTTAKLRHIFLYERVLLVCKLKGKAYNLKAAVQLNVHTKVQDIAICTLPEQHRQSSHECHFAIACSGSSEPASHVLSADALGDKNRWTRAITMCLNRIKGIPDADAGSDPATVAAAAVVPGAGSGMTSAHRHDPAFSPTAGAAAGVCVESRWELPRNRFELLKQIGSGEYSQVYKGVLLGETEVAVKAMRPGVLTKESVLKEATVLKQLQHPRIVELICVRAL